MNQGCRNHGCRCTRCLLHLQRYVVKKQCYVITFVNKLHPMPRITFGIPDMNVGNLLALVGNVGSHMISYITFPNLMRQWKYLCQGDTYSCQTGVLKRLLCFYCFVDL